MTRRVASGCTMAEILGYIELICLRVCPAQVYVEATSRHALPDVFATSSASNAARSLNSDSKSSLLYYWWFKQARAVINVITFANPMNACVFLFLSNKS